MLGRWVHQVLAHGAAYIELAGIDRQGLVLDGVEVAYLAHRGTSNPS